MISTIEISLYPLNEDYVTPIMDFIKRLKSYEGLEIVTNATSTLIKGEHSHLFNVLSKETEAAFKSGSSIFVMKVVGFDRDIQKKY